MAREILLFLSALLGVCSASDIFDQVLGDVTPCLDICELTYTLHTYPVAEDYYACRRGCRLFSIVQFVGGDESLDLNYTLTACTNACSEAYNSVEDNRFACIVGCKGEIPTAQQRQKELLEEEYLEPSIHILQPLMIVRSFYCSLWDQMHSYMTYSWSTVYMQSDNGRIYIFQSGPEIYTQSLKDGKTLVRNMETNLESLHQVNDATLYPDDMARRLALGSAEEVTSSDWLSCVSVKSGLPKWLLSTTLLLSSLALLWLCCASSATAPDHHVKSEKLSIYGDLDYLREGGYKSPTAAYLKTVSNAVESSEDQAKPLPIKVKVEV